MPRLRNTCIGLLVMKSDMDGFVSLLPILTAMQSLCVPFGAPASQTGASWPALGDGD
jgi:hypothetical protein